MAKKSTKYRVLLLQEHFKCISTQILVSLSHWDQAIHCNSLIWIQEREGSELVIRFDWINRQSEDTIKNTQ